jgi:cyclophilin family peptidyl-prolyl cis-trans isomerase
VSHSWKPIVICLSLLVLAVASGCGGDKSAPAAAIDTAKDPAKDAPAADGGAKNAASAKPTADLQHPVVEITTSLGKITVELDREKAVLTVDNFLTYVGESFYDQTVIHQVYKGQAILAGGYGTNLLPVTKSLHTAIRNEAANQLKNVRYAIAMSRFPDAIDSATSQFFINVVDNPSLDYKDRTAAGYGYCVFGKVIDGMDVVDKINSVALHDTPTLESTPVEPVIITSIRRTK